MDGRNSSGRTISLLNDTTTTCATAARLPLTTLPPLVNLTGSRPVISRSSSQDSSIAPQTPPLVRSQSSDSSSRAYASPSPLTPQSAVFEHHSSKYFPQQGYYMQRQPWPTKMDEATLFSANAYSLPPLTTTNIAQEPSLQKPSDSPISDSRISVASNVSGQQQKPSIKKTQYPCPLAKQFKCNDFFTTSGHAARHAKKHTGRKDAICPECNKAFTRKDNMEQHRRTHQNVRGPAVKSDNRVKKSKSGRKSDKGLPPTPQLEAAVIAELDDEQAQVSQTLHQPRNYDLAAVSRPLPQTMMSSDPGASYYMNPDPVNALPLPITTDFSSRPPLYRNSYTSSLDFTTAITPNLGDSVDLHFNYPSPGLSNGLNTLALAASDHRRMSEEQSSAKSSPSSSGTP